MLQKALSIIIVILVVISGCSVSYPTAEEVLEKIEAAKSYSCEAKMAVKNNKSVFYYNLKQYYMQPEKFRIEFYDDYGELKQTMIYNNGQCGIYHTQIEKPFKAQNFTDTKEHNSFVSVFLENYKKDAEARWTKEKIEDEEYFVFQCKISDGNEYFNTALLFVLMKNAVPRFLYILGEDNSKTMRVEYRDFQYNVTIDDSLFNME
ncbi:germination lipoprotein GerS-related protein [Lutispora thermophila]|uniref:Outer membrane lipoprotein-sorting protein n=1 Tax=Lutispora thermophila DSM 19022 TaxID=1122184 RepID=A0A1M6FJZ7_9FIRM|nr:germination lipoprotein GerS-related protein [Lutispora thermophila]SHI98041.1 Outer membrane lipoprotein-sorting protein [Lutispora thermophila DSM 19022]